MDHEKPKVQKVVIGMSHVGISEEKQSKENNQEKILKEKIKEVIGLPFGVTEKAQILLILLDEKPAIEFTVKNDSELFDAINSMDKIGLNVVTLPLNSDKGFVRIAVSKEKEIAKELMNLSASSDSDHKRYGQLMGFPGTAIDAFGNEEKQLGDGEQNTLTDNFPHFFNFRMSKENSTAELEVLKRWNKLILKYAPELFDELYSPDDSIRFKRNVEKM
jgi:hypothetical protein